MNKTLKPIFANVVEHSPIYLMSEIDLGPFLEAYQILGRYLLLVFKPN
jgi:hypothetical protein